MSKGYSLIRGHRTVLILSLLLATVTFAAYWRILGNDFVSYDDDVYVTTNITVRQGFTPESLRWAFSTMHGGNWHPLTWLSHMLDVELYDLKPWGHHLTSLLLHIINTVLLFLILARMTGSPWRSGFVAALFGIHPLHVESVAWVAERKDVLSTLFWILTMWAYVRYTEHPGVRRYLPVVVLFALGLMAKPMLVALPFVLLLLDYWPLKRFSGVKVQSSRFKVAVPATNTQHLTPNTLSTSTKRIVLEKAPLFALAAISSVVTFVAQQKGGAVVALDKFSPGVRIADSLVAYVAYLGKMLWPAKLAVFYPHPGPRLPEWQVVGAGVLLTLITGLAIRAGRRRRYVAVGWLWYAVTLVPVIGLVQVGAQSMADRYTYVPMIGLFILAAWGIPDVLSRVMPSPLQRAILPTAACAVTLLLAALTCNQTGYWKNDIPLFKHAIKVTGDNYVAELNLGIALEAQGKVKEAVKHYREALRLNPRSVRAHNNMGFAFDEQGRTDAAIAQYREALRLDPRFALAHTNLGNVFAKQGKLEAAIEEYEEAIRLRPDLAIARNCLGNALARQGKLDQAIREYTAALRADPYYPQAHYNLAVVLDGKGKTRRAVEEFKKAVELKPDYPEAYHNLGSALDDLERLDEAMRAYRKAIRLKPDLAEAHNNLAVDLYYKGRYAEAWKEVRLSRKYGAQPAPGFLKALAEKMPEP
jgi:tetratricopeptide (TPR) repeat protein